MEFRANLSGADLDQLTAQAAKGLRTVQRTLGRQIARTAGKAVLTDVRSRRRGGLRFGRGRLSTRSTVEPKGDRLVVSLKAHTAGAWSMVEYGTTAHEIKPRVRKALFFNELYSAYADHPGTTGHPFWTGAEPALDAALFPVIETAFDVVLLGGR